MKATQRENGGNAVPMWRQCGVYLLGQLYTNCRELAVLLKLHLIGTKGPEPMKNSSKQTLNYVSIKCMTRRLTAISFQMNNSVHQLENICNAEEIRRN